MPRLKRLPAFANLAFSPAASASLDAADRLILTQHGVWWPWAGRTHPGPSVHAWATGLASGVTGDPAVRARSPIEAAPLFLVYSADARRFILQLASRDAESRCVAEKRASLARAVPSSSSSLSPAPCGSKPPMPKLPCVLGCVAMEGQRANTSDGGETRVQPDGTSTSGWHGHSQERLGPERFGRGCEGVRELLRHVHSSHCGPGSSTSAGGLRQFASSFKI